MPTVRDPFDVPETLAALSLATDLANDQPYESALRTCALATALSAEAGGSDAQQADVFYTALLRFVGCTAYAHEAAAVMGGDDRALHRAMAPVDTARAGEVLPALAREIAPGQGMLRRTRAALTVLARRRTLTVTMVDSYCDVATRLATRLGMNADVLAGIEQTYERWDGRGTPAGRAGEAIAWSARVVRVAHQAELHVRMVGPSEACDVLRRRAGTQLDPQLVACFVRHASGLFARVAAPSVQDDVLARAPAPPVRATPATLDDVAAAFADVVDLKSVYTLGHSSAVSALAEHAARILGCSDADQTALRRAGLLHDLGRVSVPTGIWEKPGPLSAGEWERVRMHAYHTERVLTRSPHLAPLAALAGAHHERLDGSGYHRNAPGAWIPRPVRILAAADALQALRDARPHRPPLAPDAAARVLETEAREGRLDRDAVAAVLQAAGHRAARSRPAHPAGLSDREVTVLREIARGASNKDVANRLEISSRTVQHHVAHIYAKIGVTSRAGAALFAMEHDLLHDRAGARDT